VQGADDERSARSHVTPALVHVIEEIASVKQVPATIYVAEGMWIDREWNLGWRGERCEVGVWAEWRIAARYAQVMIPILVAHRVVQVPTPARLGDLWCPVSVTQRCIRSHQRVTRR